MTNRMKSARRTSIQTYTLKTNHIQEGEVKHCQASRKTVLQLEVDQVVAEQQMEVDRDYPNNERQPADLDAPRAADLPTLERKIDGYGPLDGQHDMTAQGVEVPADVGQEDVQLAPRRGIISNAIVEGSI